MKRAVLFLSFFLFSTAAQAAINAQDVEYKHGETVLQGYLAYDDRSEDIRPGVLVIHEWKGLGQYAQKRTRMLAEMGYVAFAVDMYGKNVRPVTDAEAAAQAGLYKKDRALMRERVLAGLELLKSHPLVDKSRLAVIGYCFGGMTALELGRSGAKVNGIVSFHGGLETPNPEDNAKIKAKVLVLHGADDPYVTPQEVAAFEESMKKTPVDWQLIQYSGAVHAFTNPDAGSDPSKGAAYNESADKRSWKAMQQFFDEILKANFS